MLFREKMLVSKGRNGKVGRERHLECTYKNLVEGTRSDSRNKAVP